MVRALRGEKGDFRIAEIPGKEISDGIDRRESQLLGEMVSGGVRPEKGEDFRIVQNVLFRHGGMIDLVEIDLVEDLRGRALVIVALGVIFPVITVGRVVFLVLGLLDLVIFPAHVMHFLVREGLHFGQEEVRELHAERGREDLGSRVAVMVKETEGLDESFRTEGIALATDLLGNTLATDRRDVRVLVTKDLLSQVVNAGVLRVIVVVRDPLIAIVNRAKGESFVRVIHVTSNLRILEGERTSLFSMRACVCPQPRKMLRKRECVLGKHLAKREVGLAESQGNSLL